MVIIVVVIVALVVVLPMLMSGLMYLMVVGVGSGGDTTASPTASLDVGNNSAGGIYFFVQGVSQECPLDQVMAIVHTPQEHDIMFLASGPVSTDQYTDVLDGRSYSYVDLDGGGTLTAYDRIEVLPTSGALYSGLYIVRLVYEPTGATIASATVEVP